MNQENEQFARKYGPWALIAGGSEGIGRSYALQLAARGLNLILVARRQEPLDATAREVSEHFDVQISTHSADLTALDPEHGLDEIVAGREVGMLVYNAGATHGAGFLIDSPLQNALGLVRLNCVGPLILVHSLGSRMRERGRGGMILMSSMSALGGGGYVAAYAATKAFDRALAEALWWEFGAFGVDVMGLLAGATATPAMERSTVRFDRAGADVAMRNLNIVPMTPDEVVHEALEHLGQGPIWIAGEKNRATAARLSQMPRDEVVRLMGAASAGMHGLPVPARTGG